MKFAIRDDDTSYHTKPEDLEALWSRILPFAPVSLAVTPYAVRSHHRGDLKRFRQDSRPQPLGANRELTAWLRQRASEGTLTVMCHGCTHEYKRVSDTSLVQEYIWKPNVLLREETPRAKEHLETVLDCPVNVFVPPGNGISRAAIEVLQPYFTNVLATFPLRRWQDIRFDREYAANYARRLYYQLRHGAPNPFGEMVCGVRLRPAFSLAAQTDETDLRRKLEFCRRANADFVVAVHYWEMNDRLRGILDRLLELASKWNFEFRHCGDLFESQQQARLELRPAGV